MGIRQRSEDKFAVHIAGSDYLTEVGLRQLFDDSGFINSVGVSSTGLEAIARTKAERPDIVLIDTQISGQGVIETTATLGRLAQAPKVVVLSANVKATPMEDAFRAGAYSYLLRGPIIEDIATALRIIHRGGSVNTAVPACIRQGRLEVAVDRQTLSRLKSLNARDAEIVVAVAGGHTNFEISQHLRLSEATVKARLAHLMQHLGVQNRVQIAVAAVKAGINAPNVPIPE